MKYVLCSHIFLAITLIFKTVSLMRTENYELTVAVEISLYLSVSFFRSLLWFLIYLISCGWNICFQELPVNEQRKMYKIFIGIAIFFWIDDILDKYCNKLWVFNISEIKNKTAIKTNILNIFFCSFVSRSSKQIFHPQAIKYIKNQRRLLKKETDKDKETSTATVNS